MGASKIRTGVEDKLTEPPRPHFCSDFEECNRHHRKHPNFKFVAGSRFFHLIEDANILKRKLRKSNVATGGEKNTQKNNSGGPAFSRTIFV